jgi:hypothetical protein
VIALGYKRYMSAFKMSFANFIYKNLDNLKPSSLAKEVREAECNHKAQEKYEK